MKMGLQTMPSSPQFLREQAEQCRRLAKGLAPLAARRMIAMAEEYEVELLKAAIPKE
jgi:hypothetical protein